LKAAAIRKRSLARFFSLARRMEGCFQPEGGFMCRPVCRLLRVGCVVASALAGGLFPASRSLARPDEDPFGKPAAPATSQDCLADRIQRGRELFLKRWKAADVANPTGDGLGPTFNGRSCVECHNMSRPGGAGSLEHNVDLLSIMPQPLKSDRKKFLQRLTIIDAAFTAESPSGQPNVTLHKFGVDPAYADWRKGIVATAAASQKSSASAKNRGKPAATDNASQTSSDDETGVEVGLPRADRIQLAISHRSTPALFGAGLIDDISDEVVRDIARTQAQRPSTIKGQVAVAGGKVGKFGWRGQIASLKDFVMGACANELGLEVPGHHQGIDPLDPRYHAPGLDLTQEQCDDLTVFVASLPRPQQRRPKDDDERDRWQSGEQVFETVGCANCHVRTLGSVEGLYSDLLLHDLGPSLADPVGASTPRSSKQLDTTPVPSSGYSGGLRDVFIQAPAITLRQWRTTPLWGVADSAPYMHDGRAATLEDAIKDHGGEAAAAVRMFTALPTAEREKLLSFLGSLAAPQEPTRVAKD
jgi:CxxC motif-containing protein (DUF1111 family)